MIVGCAECAVCKPACGDARVRQVAYTGKREIGTQALDVEPYFDEPYYVGFDIGGFELA